MAKVRPMLHQEKRNGCQVLLLRFRKVVPPIGKFIGVLNAPSHLS
jgi:hypothetical protein